MQPKSEVSYQKSEDRSAGRIWLPALGFCLLTCTFS